MSRRVLLFALVWLSCAWFGSWPLNPNNLTRLLAAESLVAGQHGRIDDLQALTIDKAEFDGHFYSDKAPGMTLLALPAMALADWTGPARPGFLPRELIDPRYEPWARMRLMLARATVSAPLAALAAVALYDLALALGAGAGAALFGALGFALGTPVWGWSTSIFGHAPVASLYVIATWALWHARDGRSAALAALAGGALGLAGLIEFPSVLAGSVIALWGAFRLRRPAAIAAAAIAGIAMFVLPFVGYNLWVFGTPVRLGYQGVTGFPGMDQGLFGLTLPKPHVLWAILFGLRRGLVWVAPVLVLAPFGLWRLARRELGLVAMIVAAVTVVLLVNAAYFYWDGGFSTGPRHSVPAIGLLSIGLAPFWAGLRRRWQRVGAGALLGVSIVVNLLIAAAEVTAPDTAPLPLWDPILTVDWRYGLLRTLPGELFATSGHVGAALYIVVALPLLALLFADPPEKDTPVVAA